MSDEAKGEWVTRKGVKRFYPAPLVIPPKPPKKPGRVAKCGTRGGYAKHLRLGEVPCVECSNATRDYARKRRGITGPKPLKPHGTYAAFTRHINGGTKPCEPCVEAQREYQRDRMRRTRARQRDERKVA